MEDNPRIPTDGYVPVMRQQHNAIRMTLGKKLSYATILCALSEEPCYTTELMSVGLSKPTVLAAMKYLRMQGLVMECTRDNDNLSEEDLKIINRKIEDIRRKLPVNLGYKTIERTIFYKIARRGMEFLEFANAVYARSRSIGTDNNENRRGTKV